MENHRYEVTKQVNEHKEENQKASEAETLQ